MESEVFDGKKFMALSLSMRAVNLMKKIDQYEFYGEQVPQKRTNTEPVVETV